MSILISQIRNWRLGDLGTTAANLRSDALTLDTNALTLLNKTQNVSVDWDGEARDKAAVAAKDHSGTMQQKSQRWGAAAAILDTAATQMGLLRDGVSSIADDPGNCSRFKFSDDGTVTVLPEYRAQLQLRSNCDAGLFNAWMAQVEAKRLELERQLKNLLASADSAGQYYDWQVTNALMGVSDTERPFAPRIPPPPPKPTTQRETANTDGSGPDGYNTSDPSTWDKIYMSQLRNAAKAGAWTTNLAGTDRASAMFFHFFDNSGSDYNVNVDRMLGDMPEFKGETDAEAKDQLAKSVASMPTGYTGPVSFQGGYHDNKGFETKASSNPDWTMAVHAFNYQTSGVSVPNDDASYDVDYNTSVYDYFNWDSTDASISEQYSDLNDLHRAGWAQNFDVTGTSSTQTVPGSG